MADDEYILWPVPIRGDNTNKLSRKRGILLCYSFWKVSPSAFSVQVAGYNNMSLNGRCVFRVYSEISYLHSNSIHLFFLLLFCKFMSKLYIWFTCISLWKAELQESRKASLKGFLWRLLLRKPSYCTGFWNASSIWNTQLNLIRSDQN